MKTKIAVLLMVLNFICTAQINNSIPDFKNDPEAKKILESTGFKFGMELVRLDKNNREVLIHKLEYPLRFLRSEWNEKWQTNFTNYGGRITIPLEIYNPAKAEIAQKSQKVKNAKTDYILDVTPIQKKGDTYTCQLYYMVVVHNISFQEYNGTRYPNDDAQNQGTNPYDLKLGEKVKIDLKDASPSYWGIEEKINGKNVTFNSMSDYYDYFNEYLILSLESITEMKSQPVSTVTSSNKESSKKEVTLNHIVRKGDSIKTIAKKYGVSVSSIMKWNNLKTVRLVVGKHLQIKKIISKK